MKKLAELTLIGLSVLLTTSAFAQQQPETVQDPKFYQRALEVMQIQRNQALDNAVVSEARARHISEELTTVRNKVKELETELAKQPRKPDGK